MYPVISKQNKQLWSLFAQFSSGEAFIERTWALTCAYTRQLWIWLCVYNHTSTYKLQEEFQNRMIWDIAIFLNYASVHCETKPTHALPNNAHFFCRKKWSVSCWRQNHPKPFDLAFLLDQMLSCSSSDSLPLISEDMIHWTHICCYQLFLWSQKLLV